MGGQELVVRGAQTDSRIEAYRCTIDWFLLNSKLESTHSVGWIRKSVESDSRLLTPGFHELMGGVD